MILEVADFKVHAHMADDFAAAVSKGLPFAQATPGFVSARLTRSIETPTRFVLLITWETVEAHTVAFRESENFPRWREIVGPFFDGPPTVEHVEDVAGTGA
ncbi:antibiotic biosynthesis monooxygenase family protein [Pseudonocardia sp. GCM10023141]|uniref:antibiotic biosynthesis monooxygenase family protein n=1 Tax=Pseudonocardia sp. GCM10023141 TaxID=3252653 RepID=UPI0036226BF1